LLFRRNLGRVGTEKKGGKGSSGRKKGGQKTIFG